jgi:hypothetical protein
MSAPSELQTRVREHLQAKVVERDRIRARISQHTPEAAAMLGYSSDKLVEAERSVQEAMALLRDVLQRDSQRTLTVGASAASAPGPQPEPEPEAAPLPPKPKPWAVPFAKREQAQMPLRILCIDGGGIKGLMPAIVLQRLEALCAPHKVHELFDLVCGTSTGVCARIRTRGGHVCVCVCARVCVCVRVCVCLEKAWNSVQTAQGTEGSLRLCFAALGSHAECTRACYVVQAASSASAPVSRRYLFRR